MSKSKWCYVCNCQLHGTCSTHGPDWPGTTHCRAHATDGTRRCTSCHHFDSHVRARPYSQAHASVCCETCGVPDSWLVRAPQLLATAQQWLLDDKRSIPAPMNVKLEVMSSGDADRVLGISKLATVRFTSPPTILLRWGMSTPHTLMTLVHELGHLAIRARGVSAADVPTEEALCNLMALRFCEEQYIAAPTRTPSVEATLATLAFKAILTSGERAANKRLTPDAWARFKEYGGRDGTLWDMFETFVVTGSWLRTMM